MKKKAIVTLLIFFVSLPLVGERITRNADVIRTIEQEKIHFVEFVFSDLKGNIKEIIIPAQHVERALENGLYFDGSSIEGFTEIYESDMLLKPDILTFTIIPWGTGHQKTARIICSTYRDEKNPYEADPRHVLQRVLNEARDMGFEFFVGPELEFFLFKKDMSPCDSKCYFDAEVDATLHANKKSIMKALSSQNINVEKWHHEVANGQNEMSIRYGNAIDIADQLTIAKHTVKIFAEKMGLRATFMPKPTFGQNGSGMHIHFSLFDIKNNRNSFYDLNDPHNLSQTAKYFIAGVLKYVNEIDAILNSTVNSFKRLVPGYEAPIYICWAFKNRSALIRIPEFSKDRASAARAELRCPDALCNPYLAFAVLLKAGLEGIKNKEELPEPIEENLYNLDLTTIRDNGIETLPTSLEEALYYLENSLLAQVLLGDVLLNEFLETKRNEIHQFNCTVTNWEREQYL